MPRALVLAVILTSAACTKPVAGVCCTDTADCNEIGVSDVRACDDGLVCIAHECSVPPPGTCSSDNDCGAASPHCAPDGTCVECVESDQCAAATPVCDPVAHSCRACTADTECDSGVCDVSNGTCAAEEEVAYATPNGSGASACTQADPCSIVHAFAVTDAARKTVKLAPGDYVASISVTNKSVSVHGTGALITPPSASTVLFSITDTASLELLQLKIKVRNGANAVDCRGSVASITLDEVEVDADQTAILSECTGTISRSHLHVENATGGAAVFAVSGALAVERTLIDGGGGVVNAKAVVTLSNSVITARNGGANSAFLFLNSGTNAGPIFVRFSSVVNAPVKCSDMVRCTGSAFGLCFENSIVANLSGGAPSDTVTGAGCSASYSIVFPQATALSGANNQIGVNPDLLDPINGDFHLKPGSPAVDAADPAAGESIDFDGVSRPQGAGRDIGAYELKP